MSSEMDIKNSILVVDDDQSIRTLLYTLLSESGYTVDMAGNGREGFEKIKQRSYDAIISDINMPEMNGMALFSTAICYSPELVKRFLFITSEQGDETMSFFADNRCRYMIKPFKFADMLDNVRTLLTGQQKEREERLDWSAYCQLSTDGSTDAKSVELLAKTMDISHHGAKIRYFGKPLVPSTRALIYMKEFDVKRDVTIVWSKKLDEVIHSGLISNEGIPSSFLK